MYDSPYMTSGVGLNQFITVVVKDIDFVQLGRVTKTLDGIVSGVDQIGIEGKDYVKSGAINLGGKTPNNTSGGHLCEAYTHGMNMVIENVRQLRGTVDDYCPNAANGEHTYDYSEGACRQVKGAEISMNMGWGTPAVGSALIMRK